MSGTAIDSANLGQANPKCNIAHNPSPLDPFLIAVVEYYENRPGFLPGSIYLSTPCIHIGCHEHLQGEIMFLRLPPASLLCCPPITGGKCTWRRNWERLPTIIGQNADTFMTTVWGCLIFIFHLFTRSGAGYHDQVRRSHGRIKQFTDIQETLGQKLSICMFSQENWG